MAHVLNAQQAKSMNLHLKAAENLAKNTKSMTPQLKNAYVNQAIFSLMEAAQSAQMAHFIQTLQNPVNKFAKRMRSSRTTAANVSMVSI